ncbi:MAG: hypothetical protein ACLFNQ_12820, partial [Spirochaetaceae bacterium]
HRRFSPLTLNYRDYRSLANQRKVISEREQRTAVQADIARKPRDDGDPLSDVGSYRGYTRWHARRMEESAQFGVCLAQETGKRLPGV